MDVLNLDPEVLRKAYRLGSLDPTEWEDVDPQDDTVAASAASGPSAGAVVARREEDPLGLIRGLNIAELPADLRTSVSTTSKTFDAKLFLSTVHPNASFSDLKAGGQRLKDSLEQRSEALKILVEQEFDRFVGVKVATEAVFDEMKQGPLLPESDYGTSSLKDHLKEATTKADQVYTPILENRRKAERLRSTLGVFERSKFFFNLPGTLMEAIEAGRYDTALLSYKRGRNLLDSRRPGQVLGLPAPANKEEQEQHQRIFEKVWGQVEKIIADLKTTLGKRLRDGRRGLEEVEKTIEILLELDPSDDPAWIFFDTQYEHIMQKLRGTCRAAVSKCRVSLESPIPSELHQALDLRQTIYSLDSPDAEVVLDRAMGSDQWKLILELVKRMGEVVVESLPGFLKVMKGYAEGKYQKKGDLSRSAAAKRNPSASRQMLTGLLNTFSALLSEFFLLTADPNSPSASTGNIPTFAPAHSNALTAAFFLGKILEEVKEVGEELGGLELPREAGDVLKDLVSNARFKFELTLCTFWVRDATGFFRLEEWRADPDEPSTTLYLRQFCAFHRSCAESAFRIAGGTEEHAAMNFGALEPSANARRNKPDSLPVDCVRRAQSAFLDALYAFLDGLVHVAFSPLMSLTDAVGEEMGAQQARMATLGQALSTGGVSRDIEVSNVDTRILLTISNLAHLKAVLIPRLLDQFAKAFKVDLKQDRATLMGVFAQLDKILFDDYVSRKSEHIGKIIYEGILGGSIDWFNAPKPTEVHPFIYNSLLLLVFVHAQVTTLAGPAPPNATAQTSLVNRALEALVAELVTKCLECIGGVTAFGMGGMLQATLEIEFMHQILAAYVMPQSEAVLQAIYAKISSKYTRPGDGSGVELERELEGLKRTLQGSRRGTALGFLCFKKAKSEAAAAT